MTTTTDPPAGATAEAVDDQLRRGDRAPEPGWEPIGVAPRYPPPRSGIDPDRSKGWLKRVWPIVRSHRLLLVGSLVAAVFALFAQVAVPAVTARAIDEGLIARSRPLTGFVVVLIGLGLTRGVLAFAYRYGLYRMAYRIETDLRAGIYRHLTTLSSSFYDRIQSGQVISRANSDIRSVQMFLAFAPLIALSVLSFFLALILMLTISVPLTIVSVICLPGVYILGVKLRNQIFPLSWVVQARLADVATIVDENVNGVRVVKSFAQERRQINQLARAARRLQWANVATVDSRARYTPIMENLPKVSLAIVLLYGGWLVIQGQLQLGVLVAFNAYIVMMQVPFRLLGFFMMLQQRAAASAERIYEILDESPEVVDRPGAVDLVDPDGRIEFRHVRFGYSASGTGQFGPATAPASADAAGPAGQAEGAEVRGEREAGGETEETGMVLDGFDLCIEPGETVALVGRTGSGKSTVARLLPRFYDVTDGAVLVDGLDVRDLTLLSLRASVGLVLDEPFLFSTTVRDNIAYGRPHASPEEVEAAAQAAQAHGFIEALPEGYDTVIGERGYTLSGGQRQRIAIARTLLVNPRILVLDDATSAIDVRVESEIHQALETLLEGRTTLVIAHRLSTISLADRVVLIEHGRVAATGTHAELLASEPRYAEVLAHTVDDVHGGDQADDATPTEEDDRRYRMRIAAQVSGSRPAGTGLGGLGVGSLP